MADPVKGIERTILIFNGLMVLGFLGIVWLVIYGNLSTNLGFASGTTGFNNTESVINNLTSGAGTFFGFSNLFFTIIAIVLLITLLLGLLLLVVLIVKAFKGGKGGGSFSE